MSNFSDLDLEKKILQAVSAEGYKTPTPIQAKSIPHLLEGRDLLGCAQTGTGKTAAFALPILQRLSRSRPAGKKRPIRSLILTPTRELAAQINESFRSYGRHLPLKTAVIFGGVGKRPQETALRKGVDILVATPGRLLDLAQNGHVYLKGLEVFVLDEADRMLDMGFIHDVRRVIRELPATRQTLFFSATMPKEVATLARTLLTDPVKVEVAPQATPADRIRQSVLFVDKLKKDALLESILSDKRIARALVFTRTKHRASRVAKKLARLKIPADAIHGDKAQGARTRALGAFRSGAARVLVATDIAARGIDVDGITHVINYELPNEPESYVHRIGRTARAGHDGAAISFCSGDERDYLNDIEKTIRLSIKVVRSHSLHSAEAEQGLVNGEDGAAARKRKAANRFAPRRGKQAGKSRPGAKSPRPSEGWRSGKGGKKSGASGPGKPRRRTRRGHGTFRNG
ncbi:ATP-dependent RNA helicase RhlE [Candidatus Desulfarcum epimagneticum]|uniref:DEAD-box ATP-dependent RNA helicase RhpA n=1 Tax=uncultured Desulfobacteraceae bacterium TaxID=218296 RepID=A0A484HFJ4_9BACT|nr:ATP-dependent RNA helicase RhlE [uncultured Desulfobacteraceae bacterium]